MKKITDKTDEVYPKVKGDKYVCSDGMEFSDIYFAKNHEQSLKTN